MGRKNGVPVVEGSPDVLTILQNLVADGAHGKLNLCASCRDGVQLALGASLPLDSHIVLGLDVVQQLLDCVHPGGRVGSRVCT